MVLSFRPIIPDLIKIDFSNGFDGGVVINALGLEDKSGCQRIVVR